jgi:TP901 family phage tail tape measure protein
MSITVAQLVAKINADTSGLEAGVTKASGLLGPGGMLRLGIAGAAVGVVALGVASTKMAGDFQKGMTTLVTGAGESRANLQLVSNGTLQLARDTGTVTSQLTAGMFMVESAGYHGKAGLDVLKAAAEGAKVGNADLGVTADAVTTIMNDYAASHVSAAQATNVLIATVASGKTHMADLAGSVAMVLPTAAAYHVQLTDVAGALATMTASGVPAADAATYLRQTLIGLGSPTSAAAKALKLVGLTTDEVNESLKKSLPDTLRMITDAIGKKFPEGSVQYNEALKQIAGGSKQMQGMLDLTGAHLGTFQQDVKAISAQVQSGGKSIVGWSDVQKDMNFQFSRAKEVAETLMIELGQKLLPAATDLFKFIADKALPTLSNMVSWFTGASTSAQLVKSMLLGLGIAIIASLVPSFIAWAVSAGAAAVATIAATWPILAVGAAIGGIIFLLKQAYDHWTGFRVVVNLAGAAIHGMWDWLGKLIGKIGDLLGVLGHVKDAIGNAFGGAGKALGSIHIPGFAGGGTMPSTGIAVVGEQGPELVRLPGGSQVIPLGASGGLGANSGGGASGRGEQTIIVQLDGRIIAQAAVRNFPQVIRLATGSRGF